MSSIFPPRSARRSRRALPAAVALATAIGLLAAACGGATPSPAPSATPLPSGDVAALYRAIEDQVVAERGLPAKERLEPTLLSEDEARTRIAADYRAENPPEVIATSEATLKALGLLPADASLESLYVDLLSSQVAAFYDPKANQIFVISKSGSIGAAEKVYFSHEFTHALQDQNFGTEVNVEGQGDRSLARLSLLEGDASLLMTRWLTEHLTAAEIQELLQVDPEAQAQLDRMPAILRETLLFPYQQGLILVTGAWARGGWEAVDRMYGALPDSTEQVLHPEKYEAREKPVDVPLDADALATAMGSGWSGTPEDTLGEFQLSVWLRENGVKALDAQAAAAGWGGDRLAYLRGPDGGYALAIASTWDTAADADEFLAAANTAAGRLPGAARALRGTDARSVWVLAADDAATLDQLARAVSAT